MKRQEILGSHQDQFVNPPALVPSAYPRILQVRTMTPAGALLIIVSNNYVLNTSSSLIAGRMKIAINEKPGLF